MCKICEAKLEIERRSIDLGMIYAELQIAYITNDEAKAEEIKSKARDAQEEMFISLQKFVALQQQIRSTSH